MIELYALLCTIAKYPMLIQGEKHMKKLLLGASIIALTAVTSLTFAVDQTNDQMQTQPATTATTATPDTQQAMPTNTDNSATTTTTTPDADQAAADKKKQEMMDQTQQPANTTPATQPAAPSQSGSSSY